MIWNLLYKSKMGFSNIKVELLESESWIIWIENQSWIIRIESES